MILFELTNSENHDAYKELELSNGLRQYDFLRSITLAALKIHRPLLSHQVIKALNYHAIACLHTNPGEYRPCPVTVGDYRPPESYQVQALMDDFVDQVNRFWELDPIHQCSWILWRLNHIHPFINGNGRTARAVSYFVLCLRFGGPLPGEKTLPMLLKENRVEYVAALKEADAAKPDPDLARLSSLVSRLLDQQVGNTEQPRPQSPMLLP